MKNEVLKRIGMLQYTEEDLVKIHTKQLEEFAATKVLIALLKEDLRAVVDKYDLTIIDYTSIHGDSKNYKLGGAEWNIEEVDDILKECGLL